MLKPRNNRRPYGIAVDLPRWIVMTDEDRMPVSLDLVAALPFGSAVIIRNRDQEQSLADARAVRELAARQGITISVSLSSPITGPLPTNGLHIPERSLVNWKASDLGRLQPGFITTSAHSRAAAWRGWCIGADAVLLSPVFPTASHPEGQALGLMRFAAIAGTCPFPIYALGGVTMRSVRRTLQVGAQGIAGISLFTAPDNGAEK